MGNLTALSTLLLGILISFASSAGEERLLGILGETSELGRLTAIQDLPSSLLSVAGVKVFSSELRELQAVTSSSPRGLRRSLIPRTERT